MVRHCAERCTPSGDARSHNFGQQAAGGTRVTDNLSPLNDFEKVD